MMEYRWTVLIFLFSLLYCVRSVWAYTPPALCPEAEVYRCDAYMVCVCEADGEKK